jgi:DNA-binding response OmpR family regulator
MIAEKTIVLALKDTSELDIINNKLKDKGYKLVSSNDGAKVMEMALKTPPALIIVDMDLPVISGEKLFHIMMNNPNTSDVPFLFISDKEAEVSGFRGGRDVFLIRPFNIAELLARLRQTILFSKDGKKAVDSKEIEGRLSQMSLADLLQILHLNKKEGELKIKSGDSVGTIYLKKGNVYNAVLNETEKEKALYRLLAWNEGTFSFHPQVIQTSQRIQSSTGNLLMEGMRQIDEYEKAKHLFPESTSTLKTKVDTATLPKGLKPIIYEILFLVDFYPGIGELVDHCSFPDYEVYQTLQGLLTRGIIETVKPRKKEEEDDSNQIVTRTQAIKIKEKVISRWGDMLSVNFGKIFIASTSPELSMEFIFTCKALPSFSINQAIAASRDSNRMRMGDIGTLKIFGGLDVILYTVPTEEAMAPLLRAFSSNLIGLMLLWDENTAEKIPLLVDAKHTVLSHRRVPTQHIYASTTGIDRELSAHFRRTFSLKSEDPLFTFKKDDAVIQKIFRTFFEQLSKDDYAATGQFST